MKPESKATRRAGIAVLMLIGAAGAQGVSGRGSQEASDARSKAVFVRVCGQCHPTERVTAMRRTRPQWEESIETMITVRGAKVTDEEFDTVLGYLVKEHGRVDVNRAMADDIVEVLGIAKTMAEKIVAYRREHGSFEDFEALAKVPGIDREELEKKRDAISF